MKFTSKILMAIIVLLSNTMSYAQIKNAKTESMKIYGNCEICKATIEKAGNLKKTAKVDWNEETKMASITYDTKLTNATAILKRIALAGYDSDSFLATDLAYSKLKECCRYERKSKILQPTKIIVATVPILETPKTNEHAGHNMPMEPKPEAPVIATNTTTLPKVDEPAVHNMPMEQKKEVSQMQAVFNSYFEVKDALVNTDSKVASVKAAELVKTLNAVKMMELEMEVHMVWMKVLKDLGIDAKRIADSKRIDEQRKYFTILSKNLYPLMKASKTETPTYYQHCPMANNGKGADWLSKESEIKNPYYGSEMMTCGKTVETILK